MRTVKSLLLLIAVAFLVNVAMAQPAAYQVDKSFNGAALGEMKYLAKMSNDQICGINQKTKKIVIFDGKGKVTAELPYAKVDANENDKKEVPYTEEEATALAVDANDNIYVFNATKKTEDVESRGKVYRVSYYIGAECVVMDKKGTVQKTIKLPNVSVVNGAKITNDKIIVADASNEKRRISVFTLSGGLITEIKNLRACCGISDFDVTPKNEIMYAHLGAFKVEWYDLSGKSVNAFGERGNSLNQFQGCCNPVSVGLLSTGGVVTVEKDPTRIKVYNEKQEAALIDGIGELVEGCLHIPIAIDSKDCIYLASNKGVIKCIKK